MLFQVVSALPLPNNSEQIRKSIYTKYLPPLPHHIHSPHMKQKSKINFNCSNSSWQELKENASICQIKQDAGCYSESSKLERKVEWWILGAGVSIGERHEGSIKEIRTGKQKLSSLGSTLFFL